MFLRVLVLLGCLAVPACSAGEREADEEEVVEAPPELTREQRDSIIAQSRLPGAGAVGKAIETSEAMRARAARMDSTLQN